MQPGAAMTEAGLARNRGLWYAWGPQAWIDMWMSNTMLVKKAMPIISHTFVPILRLTADPEQIDLDYAEIRSRRESISFFESPREKWRKRYGNFVREVEWALLELRKHFNQEEYEDIVVGTSVALAHENAPEFLNMMNSMADKNKAQPGKPAKPNASTKPSWSQRMMFNVFNPAGWLTGPAEVTSIDLANGSTTMEIPDCAWHICATQDSLPNPKALPEEGCLYICKGPFEAMFKGENGGLKVEFEPHLPETSCSVRMSWDPR
jgi:hypothetical protein